ncbi:Menaquinone reductase, iron-sulfur cluster-binding subunit [bacterium HR15]|nr:Menaquinone reductase, iron-sulfur cluster-binding subunit [bacterium HR15]
MEKRDSERLWRSLNERENAPQWKEQLQREFAPEAAPHSDLVSRRQFLKLMGASMALAGLSACGYKPQGPIIARAKIPEEAPGESLYYATAVTLGGYAKGVLARVYEGRPIKLEGNDLHPASLGSTDAFTQAEILNLYDPDRSQNLLKFGQIQTWQAFTGELMQQLAIQQAKKGSGIRLLTEVVTSPSLAAQIQAFLKAYPQAKWYQWEAINSDNIYEGTRLAFGEWLNPIYRVQQAKVILALDSDFLYMGPAAVRYAREFADGRRVRESQRDMNRLYVAEPMPTVTGFTADHRLPIHSSRIGLLAAAIAQVVGAPLQVSAQGALTPEERKWAEAVARDLMAHRGESLVIVGEAQPPAVHAIAHAINAALGNLGKTVVFTAPPEAKPTLCTEDIRTLAREIEQGQVEVLIMLGTNPAYDAPAELNFAELIPKVPFSVHLSRYTDETSALCVWHVPESHPFETWGDARAFDGTVTIQQPLIFPLYPSTRSALELMAQINGQGGKQAFDLVQGYWKTAQLAPTAQFDAFWRKSVHDGIIPRTALPIKAVSLRPNLTIELPLVEERGLEIRFAPDPTMYDGRFANNTWLQELPKPVSRICWDNVAFMSLKTAQQLGVVGTEKVALVHDSAPLVQIRVNGRTLIAAAYPIPGHVDNAITLHLGYGRTRAGSNGSGTGFNTYTLRTSDAMWFTHGAEAVTTGQRYTIARTEEHHLIEHGELDSMHHRPIMLIGTLQEFQEDPHLKKHRHGEGEELPSMYKGFRYDRYQNPDNYRYAWAMVIDPTVCTGCSACVTACQAENNIPVVGKREVVRQREMFWLRIDRYFKGPVENPRTYQLPVPCMQCENAPCELVCPVAATVHSEEGLNQMVYNRCVGTRYCSNNCPYKVRRFNFYRYTYYKQPVLHLLQNPDVTVRGRGVMEKCTYCVQRINRARIQAKKENRRIRDGEIIPACQQACPTKAIVFGDMNDPDSEVSRLRREPHLFSMLAELNTKPRTTYLAKIENPNPELSAEAHDAGSH